ncbi:MAG: AraC family transcriptional regulator [Phycisphaerales bacterium]|nr:AraC family transcriptional regulator [Phycisphaerales bacterium]
MTKRPDKARLSPSPKLIAVRHRFPSLKSLGVAVEYFPRFSNGECRLHAVDVVLFSVALRGTGKHYIDRDAFDMGPGCVGITSYGQHHDIVTTRHGMEKFNVYLDLRSHPLPRLSSPLADILETMIPLRQTLQHRLNRAFQFQVSDTERLRHTLHRLDREIHRRQPGYVEIVRGCLTSFLVDCCRDAQASGLVPLESQDASFPTWVRELRTRLDDQFHLRWTLEGIAKEYGISVGHLCRTFQRYTGKPVMDYLIGRRIASAMTKLGTTTSKVSHIASALGFQDSSYFHRQFKRRTGQTPAEYRRAQHKPTDSDVDYRSDRRGTDSVPLETAH